MTISATSTFDLSRDRLIRRAYQLCGLLEAAQSPSGDDISLGADLLTMELLALQGDGVPIVHITRTTLALVAGTVSYSLPSDTFDIFIDGNNFAGTYIPSSGTTEAPVRAISRTDYMAIPTKTTTGQPTLVYVERLAASTTLSFWPAPNATATFKYAQIRLARDLGTGPVTVDMARRWQKALAYLLAYQLAYAKSVPLERVRELKKEAAEMRARALASDVEKVHLQMWVPGGERY